MKVENVNKIKSGKPCTYFNAHIFFYFISSILWFCTNQIYLCKLYFCNSMSQVVGILVSDLYIWVFIKVVFLIKHNIIIFVLKIIHIENIFVLIVIRNQQKIIFIQKKCVITNIYI